MFRAKHPRRGVLALLASPLLALIPRKAGADMPEPYSAYADQYSGNGSPASAPPSDDTGGITPGTLIERLERIERWMAMHGGNIGAANAQYPHPDTSIRTAFFGNGEMRLDELGIQILGPSGGRDGIAWVGTFVEPPSDFTLTYPVSRIRGEADSTPSLDVISAYDANTNGTLGLSTGADSATAGISAQSTYGTATVVSVSDSSGVRTRTQGKWQWDVGSFGAATIATGAITCPSKVVSSIDTEAAAASDDLDTISGGLAGQMIILRAANSARTVVLKNGTGNLSLGGDITLDHTDDVAVLLYTGSVWICLAQQNNNA